MWCVQVCIQSVTETIHHHHWCQGNKLVDSVTSFILVLVIYKTFHLTTESFTPCVNRSGWHGSSWSYGCLKASTSSLFQWKWSGEQCCPAFQLISIELHDAALPALYLMLHFLSLPLSCYCCFILPMSCYATWFGLHDATLLGLLFLALCCLMFSIYHVMLVDLVFMILCCLIFSSSGYFA